MTERNWQADLEQLLHARFAALCAALHQPVPLSGLRIAPPLTQAEARDFLLGQEAGLFELDTDGYVQSPLLPPSADPTTRQEMCQIFWDDPLPPRLLREAICQLATASALVLDRGWLRSQVKLAPSIQDETSGAEEGVDILITSTSGQLFAGAEVKRSAAELEKLRRDFSQCCRRGTHAKSDCGFPQNHAKYDFCASRKPRYLWAVAPAAEMCFELSYRENERIELEELPTLPRRSVIEMTAAH